MSSSRITPSTPKSRNLSRDQCLQVKTLHDLGMNQTAIARQLGITPRQVGYCLRRKTLTPIKKKGRPSILSSEDVDLIEEFILSTPENRRMTFLELASGPFRHLGVSERVIQSQLKKRGYKRHPAKVKPPASLETRRRRKAWAEAHLDWTVDQWMSILWTDETWARDGRHSRQWVTRKAGEEYCLDCVEEKMKQRVGWMFWGSFAGSEKGPCLFWEKEWGKINSESYCDRILPLKDGMASMRPWLSVMQDNAPAHIAESTMEMFAERQIVPIDWPANSPDLNPIEAVWGKLKDYIQLHYPNLGQGRQRSHNKLRSIVKEAWDSVSPEDLIKLVESMPVRCQAVMDADGGPTKY